MTDDQLRKINNFILMKLSKIFVMPCKPRHRGSEVHKIDISDEQVCISCMADNHNNRQAEIAGLGRITINQLSNLHKIKSDAILIRNKPASYQKYAKKFFACGSVK